VLNLNVPNLPVDQMRGWKETPVGAHPPRTLSTAGLEPKQGHEGTYRIRMDWGEALPLDPDTDGGAVMGGWVSLTWLGHLSGSDAPSDNPVATALDGLFA
jgi:broad specificity polyphosphatase/5'/3'-nucleotidase SurE